jgi:hypothetical protein
MTHDYWNPINTWFCNATCSITIARLKSVHRVLVGNPEGKRPLRRPNRRWEDNIKMDFRKLEEVVWTGWSWLRIGTGGGHL